MGSDDCWIQTFNQKIEEIKIGVNGVHKKNAKVSALFAILNDEEIRLFQTENIESFLTITKWVLFLFLLIIVHFLLNDEYGYIFLCCFFCYVSDQSQNEVCDSGKKKLPLHFVAKLLSF